MTFEHRQLRKGLCALACVCVAGAHAADEEAPDVADYRAQWEALAGSVGVDDEARRRVWERLEAGSARIEEISREAVIAECEERGIGFEGVWVYPEALAREHPEDDAGMSEATLGASERAFPVYIEEMLYQAPDRVRRVGDVHAWAGWQPFPDLGVEWFGPLRTFGRWETLRAWRLLQAGDGAAAAKAFENILALGGVSIRTPLFMGAIAGYPIAAMPFGSLKEWIANHGMDEATATAFGTAMDRQRATMPPVDFTIEGERLWALGMVAKIFAEIDAGTFDAGEDEELKRLVEGGVERTPTIEAIEAYFPVLQEWAVRPVPERAELGDALERTMAEMERKAPLAALMAGTGRGCVRACDHMRCSLDGLRLMLALEAHKARHGGYPEGLAALAPEFIPAIPDDPYAPDGSWRYRLVEPGEGGRAVMGYVLYSVGYDGEDNGGRRAKWPAFALYPGEEGEGTDFVVIAVGE